MHLAQQTMKATEFNVQRETILETWPTGHGLALEHGFNTHEALPPHKVFATLLDDAEKQDRVLLQPRAGVALVEDHIRLLKYLQEQADLLPTTIDAYTRHNNYKEAEAGIKKSAEAGHSLLNGFPAVNHGVSECKKIISRLEKPVQVRHGTPDARLLAEITLAAGFTSFEGGGISYNIPYAKLIPLDVSIRNWQYVDRLCGLYEENNFTINREPFGPLSGTLVPPFMSHVVAIIEGLLALEQGVKSLTLGYGQTGNMLQDVAAIQSLKELAHHYFQAAGFSDYHLTTAFHQWMGGFPEDASQAFAVIAWGGAVAALSGATKVIVKTPHEALGIPTKGANLEGLKATRQIIRLAGGQRFPECEALSREVEMIKQEVNDVMAVVLTLSEGVLAQGVVRAFEAGVLDIPFAPSVYNKGKLLPVRDNNGAVRILDKGFVPLGAEALTFHRDKISERERHEGRAAGFQMVIDDIYAISKGKLVGRPK